MLVVLDIMQHIGIGTTGNNWGIGKTFGAVTQKLMYVLGLDLVFPYAGLYKPKNSAKALVGDIAGLL